MGDTVVAVCYRLPDQEQAAEAFRQLEETSHSQAMVLMGILNYPNICWMGNTEHEQSGRFLECTDTLNGFLEYSSAFNFLTQVIKK